MELRRCCFHGGFTSAASSAWQLSDQSQPRRRFEKVGKITVSKPSQARSCALSSNNQLCLVCVARLGEALSMLQCRVSMNVWYGLLENVSRYITCDTKIIKIIIYVLNYGMILPQKWNVKVGLMIDTILNTCSYKI